MIGNPKLFLSLLAVLQIMAQDPAAMLGTVQGRQDIASSGLTGTGQATAPSQAETPTRALQAGSRADQYVDKNVPTDESERAAAEIRQAKARDRGNIKRFAADLFEARESGTAATDGGISED